MSSDSHEIGSVTRARAGDPAAWDALLKRYQLPLFSFVHSLVRDQEHSLDIVQESFVNAVRHLHTLRADAKFGSWLFGIARQKCAQHWRKPAHNAPPDDLEGLDPADPEPDPRDLLIAKEQEEAFVQALEQLPPAHREVLLLHCLEDFSHLEIADITGQTVGTVKSRLHYARKHLRSLLDSQL